ncbi:hypothetical protein LTR95_006958 [Oleoguttula sp. CCFEE 5521]
MEADLDPWLERSLLEIRLKLAKYIMRLQGAHGEIARKMLEGWIFQMALLDQLRTAMSALTTGSTNGPGVFLPSIMAHIDDLVDIHADYSDADTDSAIEEPREGLDGNTCDNDLTDSLRNVNLTVQSGEADPNNARPDSDDETKLRGHDVVVRLLFDTLQQASKLSDRRFWLCPLHADAEYRSTTALHDHLMDGTHGVSEEQAKILVAHAVTRPMSEDDDAWEPNCDAQLIGAHGQVMAGVAAIVTDFCIAADTVQQAIMLCSDNQNEGRDNRLVGLRQLHVLLTQASLQCRQHCHDGQQQFGVAFQVGDDIAFQDLYNVHRGLSRQLEDIADFIPSTGMSLTHHRNVCSITQRGRHEAVLAMAELIARLTRARVPESSSLNAADTRSLLHAWLSGIGQHYPAVAWRNTVPFRPAGNESLTSRRAGKMKSVTSSASTVFSRGSTGVSAATSVTSADVKRSVFGVKAVERMQGYRGHGDGASFFVPGRVFETLRTNIAHSSEQSSSATSTSTDSYGQALLSKRRAFISIHADFKSCRAIPITSYGGQGVSKYGVIKDRHCIVHTTALPPERLDSEAPDLLQDEEPMQPYPIRVNPDAAARWALHETSRVNLDGEQTVEYHTPVKNLGKVDPASMPYLELQHKTVRELRYRHSQNAAVSVDFSVEEALVVLARSGISPETIQEQIHYLRI